MPPILHVMRHGQGYHSVADNGHSIHDPSLTPEGEEQCRKVCKNFTRHDQVELLVASPLRRALQTCAIAMEPCVKRGLKIVALPYAEEASDAPCDTGSEVELLKTMFPEHVDFDNVKHGWWVHEGEYAFDTKALISRAATLRRWLKNRPEKEVVLVAHGFFNHFLTGDVDGEGNQSTPWWGETELRTYTFVEEPHSADGAAFIGGDSTHDGEDSAMIKETEESLKRLEDRRGSVVKNKNVPAQRKKSIFNYGADNELN